MQNWKHIAHESKDILTVCLAKAIDTALTAQQGAAWFDAFAAADAKEKVNVRITKGGQTSAQDLDLQALLKFLRYRGELTQQVLTYYGFFDGLDSFAIDAQWYQLNQLLDRLMNDFRNRIEAHSRAADIEREIAGQHMDRIYGYEEAVQDMYKLARIFAKVKDSKGISYCRRIETLTGRKKRRWWIPVVALVLAAAIAAGGLWWHSGRTYTDDSAPVYVEGQVVVQPIRVYYEGDELVALCYVTNGAEDTATSIDVRSFAVLVKGQELAIAGFGVLEGVELAPNDHMVWEFRFPKSAVVKKNARLNDAEFKILTHFE